MQVPPAPGLRNYVRHYLWIEKADSIDDELRIFGDGNPGIVFCCEGSIYADALRQRPYPPVFGYGQINACRTIYAPHKVKLLIVVLHPFALSALLKTPAGELNDELLTADGLFAAKYATELEQVMHAAGIANKLFHINNMLSKVFDDSLPGGEMLVAETIRFIRKLDGNVDSARLSHFSGYSERYLEKQFKQYVGIGPKKFARITRLLAYIKLLQKPHPGLTLSSHAHQLGYFDQAHLNHDFKTLTGITPSAYSHNARVLALNLITLRQP
ncbi:helix-turn-helix transcriptional regulator [Mucilaginibacter pedocola]|uniref:HTH araC/xylS-type domain-containing protein n=1 Tax=Mucilaginibacter pedocola TaxID=1792845 RepID=A0A1S9P6H5_9SPHI|nr:helix-turn-helix transcriptional regulator [Mucilaginibacter pedocola]OOQ56545.1 hypothetical protein BC343_19090 [Mucilaginibacter pedocola]